MIDTDILEAVAAEMQNRLENWVQFIFDQGVYTSGGFNIGGKRLEEWNIRMDSIGNWQSNMMSLDLEKNKKDNIEFARKVLAVVKEQLTHYLESNLKETVVSDQLIKTGHEIASRFVIDYLIPDFFGGEATN